MHRRVLPIVVLLVLAACGSDPAAAPEGTLRSTTSAPTTAAPSTAPSTAAPSTPASTSAAATEPSVAATTAPAATTVAPADDGAAGFVPACVDRLGDGSPAETLVLPETLGPLGVEPDLVIELPRFRDRIGTDPADVVADVTPIAGGVLVLISQDSYDEDAVAWQLVAIDHGGGVRWRRCGTDRYAQGIAVTADRAIVWTLSNTFERASAAFDLRTGDDLAMPVVGVAAGAQPVASSSGFQLLSQLGDARVDVDTDRMLLLDLTTGSVEDVPYPERAGGQEAFRLIWALVGPERPGDAPVVLQYDPFGAAVGAYVDGAWTTDPSDIARWAEPQARMVHPDGGSQPGVELIEVDGSQRWFAPTEGGLPGEGFSVAIAGDVVLANVCRQADPSVGCARGEFAAFDVATGDQRWALPGFRSVGVVGERVAIVGDEPVDGVGNRADRMIDLATGEPIPGQEWDGAAFDNACCGDGDYIYTGRAGGLVWAKDYTTIRLYYPEALSAPTVTVDLGI